MRRLRAEPMLLVLAAAAAAAYTAYGWLRHADLRTSLDVAIFDQAVWHYSRFEAPVSTLTGPPDYTGLPNVLGDHFHPVLALLAPLYWVWADPRMLLAAQAVLLAAAAIPIFVYARARVGRWPALAIAAAYLSSWTVLSAVGFDFHELAFAPLAIACAVLAADRRRWWAYAAAVLVLLLTKEDLAILVATLGAVLVLQRRVRAGLATLAAGVGAYGLISGVAIPHFSGGRPYPHWSYDAFGPDAPSALWRVLTHPLEPIAALFDDSEKLRTYAALLVPVLGLVLASPLLLAVVPLLAERMLSSNANYWGTGYHYSLTVAPLLFMGAADGLGRLVRSGRARGIAAGAMLTLSAVGGAVLSPVAELGNADLHRRSAAEAEAIDQLRRIPAGASVAAQVRLLPHVARRDEVRVLQPGVADTDYVLFDRAQPPFPSPSPEAVARTVDERRGRYRVVASAHGVELLVHIRAAALAPR